MFVQGRSDKLNSVTNQKNDSIHPSNSCPPKGLLAFNPIEAISPTMEQQKMTKSRVINERNPLHLQKVQNSRANHSKERSALDMTQKLIKSICSQVDLSLKGAQQTVEIKLNSLMLHRIDELKTLISQLKENQSEHFELQPNQKDKQQRLQYKNDPQLKQYIERQTHIKKQLTKLIQAALSRRYHALNIFQLLNGVGTIVTELKKEKEGNTRLQNENRKIRLHYLAEIQQYKEEISFIRGVLEEKEQQVKELQKELYEFKKDRHFFQKGTEGLFQIQFQKPSTANLLTENSTQLLNNKIYSIIQSGAEQKSVNSRQNSSSRLLANQKSKSDIYRFDQSQQLYDKTQQEKASYFQLAATKELNQLLPEKTQGSDVKLACSTKKLEALNDEINLLEQNLWHLTEQINSTEMEFIQKQQTLEQLSQQIINKQQQLQYMQQKMTALLQQQALEQQNIEKTQQQLQFLQEQCKMVQAEIEDHKVRRIASIDYENRGIQVDESDLTPY